MHAHRWLCAAIALGGCGGPGASVLVSTAANPTPHVLSCPWGADLKGEPPPKEGRPTMLTVGWYEVACYDGDGDHHGPAVTFWPNGKPYSDGAWEHGLETGTWTFYYDTGEVFARGSYREGIVQPGWTYLQLDGKPVFFARGGAGCPDGTRLASEPTVEDAFEYWCEKPDGTRHGPAAMWRGISGWMFTQYRDGNEDGTSVRWGEDRIRYVRVYDNGWHLSETMWYGDHPFSYIEQRKDNGGTGLDNGAQRSWYPDGTIETEGTNLNGYRHGTWTYYDPTGTPVARATYDHSQIVSRDDIWHCLDAQHLLRASDLGRGLTASRLPGEPETGEFSSVRVRGGGKEASLRLWKSNYDDGQNWYAWLKDEVQHIDHEHSDEFAFESDRATYHGDPAVLFMDHQMGAVVLLVCPAPACKDHDAAVELAKVAHERLVRDRWCLTVEE